MLNRSLLKVLPIVFLSFGPIVGMGGVARSQVTIQPSVNQRQTINQLIQQLKTGDLEARSAASKALGKFGRSAIPSLTPLLKDPDDNVRSATAQALNSLGYKP